MHSNYNDRGGGLILGPNSGSSGNDPRQRGTGRPGQPGRLIMPGENGGRPQNVPSKLIVPKDSEQGPSQGRSMEGINLGDGMAPVTPGTFNSRGFRPPPGFMNTDGLDAAPANLASLTPQQMLSKISSHAGKWHQLAKLLPLLNAQGYSDAAIDEAAGLTPAQQNVWKVAATVYDSLVTMKVPPSLLAHFDTDGEGLLHPFRFLSAERRVAAAEFIKERRLDQGMCEVLARSMKEYERRPSERAGFTEAPGDCLAFKYLRDAVECRKREEAVQKVQQGLSVAVSATARKRLEELIKEEPTAAESVGRSAKLTMLRLAPEEASYRPISLLGALDTAGLQSLQAAARTVQEGTFGAFSIDGGAAAASRWVALPQWKAVSMARHPVALSITDCATVPAVVAAAQAKTDEDRRRLSGVGLLVADRDPAAWDEVRDDTFYLAVPSSETFPAASNSTATRTILSSSSTGGQPLKLIDGETMKLQGGFTAVAVVLFLCRPPTRDAANLGTDLLQV